MKKIILAPAVALAFTGLVASPVAAAESPSAAQSASTKAEQQKQDEAEQAKKDERPRRLRREG
jgi:ribosomal protein L12E/L44/L45/RPP1/RPP2